MQSIALIATYGTIIEVTLIVTLVVVTFFLRFYNSREKRREQRLKSKIQTYLIRNMNTKTQIGEGSLPAQWLNLELLLETVAEFDETYRVGSWLYLRANFIKNIILPLARTSALSGEWNERFDAANAFTLYSENEDETLILTLLNDPIPLVRYSAAAAGIKHGSEMVINSIIVQISRESWLTQTMYMKGFVTIPFATHYYLENIMKNSNDFSIRATTYNLLLRFPVFPTGWDIKDDIRSPVTLLAIASIRYLAYSKNVASVDTLLGLLSTSNWKVKTVVLACLGDLKLEEAITGITSCLNDPNWWVRFSANQALNKIGLPGKSRGDLSYIATNRFNIDVSKHVLNTF